MKKYKLTGFAFISVTALLLAGSAWADELSDAAKELEINVKNVQASAEVAGAALEGDTDKLRGTIMKRDVLDAARDEFAAAKDAGDPTGMQAAVDKAGEALGQDFSPSDRSGSQGPDARQNAGGGPGDPYDPVFADEMPWQTGLQRIINKKEWASFWKAGKSGKDRFGAGRFGDRDATPQ